MSNKNEDQIFPKTLSASSEKAFKRLELDAADVYTQARVNERQSPHDSTLSDVSREARHVFIMFTELRSTMREIERDGTEIERLKDELDATHRELTQALARGLVLEEEAQAARDYNDALIQQLNDKKTTDDDDAAE